MKQELFGCEVVLEMVQWTAPAQVVRQVRMRRQYIKAVEDGSLKTPDLLGLDEVKYKA